MVAADDLEVLDIHLGRARVEGYSVELHLGERVFPAGLLEPAGVEAVQRAEPGVVGARLFAALMADDRVRQAWAIAAGRHPRRRIRLRIDDAAPELHALPWELLCDASPGSTARLLAADDDTPFSRHVPGAFEPLPAVEARPIRLLSAIAAPTGVEAYQLQPLDRAVEEAGVAAAMAAAPAGLVEHTALAGPCTLAALEARLERGYHVLHLVAHGLVRRDGAVALVLERADGSVERVDDVELAAMIERLSRTLRLVVLMCCHSAHRHPEAADIGLTPRLLAAGVPAVLAMHTLMPIDAARAFTRAFYAELWSSGAVDRAANRARAKLLTGNFLGSNVPTLYSALARNQLWLPATPAVQQQQSPPPAEPARDAWQTLDGRAQQLSAARDGAGGVSLFTVDGEALSVRRRPSDGAAWGPAQPLDAAVAHVTTTLDARGRLALFVLDAAGECRHRRERAPGVWGPSTTLGPDTEQIAVVCRRSGMFGMFALGVDGLLYSIVQQGAHWSAWQDGWEQDDEAHLQIAAALDANGLGVAFSLHTDGSLWICQELDESGDDWSDWFALGGELIHAQVILHEDRLRVHAIGQDGALWQIDQEAAGGEWGEWRRRDAALVELALARPPGADPVVIGLGADRKLRRFPADDAQLLDAPAAIEHVVAVAGPPGAIDLFAVDAAGRILHRLVPL